MQIESEFVLVKIHRRQSDGTWTDETIEDFGVAIPVPSMGASITLDEVYDTLDLQPRPRLMVVANDHTFEDLASQLRDLPPNAIADTAKIR